MGGEGEDSNMVVIIPSISNPETALIGRFPEKEIIKDAKIYRT